LKQGLAFRSHDETPSSSNNGNSLVNHNETTREVWKNTRGNLELTSPHQKEIV